MVLRLMKIHYFMTFTVLTEHTFINPNIQPVIVQVLQIYIRKNKLILLRNNIIHMLKKIFILEHTFDADSIPGIFCLTYRHYLLLFCFFTGLALFCIAICLYC